MSAFIATCFNPVTKKIASSQVTEFEKPFVSLLHAAQTRARTLRTLEKPVEVRAKCILKVIEPNGKIWELHTVLGREFWKEAGE